ncbi:hypothetical protein Tco_1343615, partial [Tanacetum coccineum]
SMADLNIPADIAPAEQAPAVAPPTRTDDQILPSSKWVPIGKSNSVLDVQKAFTASSTIPAMYIKQFWDTMCFNPSKGLYNCQLDEQWFNLHKDILRDALGITPANDNNPFEAPPSSDTVIEYVNTLGYPSTLRNVSAMSVNALYQPWRAILSMINMCLTKPARKDRREVFGMPIPDALLTDEITSAPYYSRYLEHVAEYQHCLDEEHGKAEEEDVTESPKAVKATKSKTAKQTKPSAPKASKVTTPPKPIPTTTEPSKKDQSKKHKLVKETFDAPSPVKLSKAGKVIKQQKPKSPLQLIDEFVDEGVPEQEPVYGDEEADIQRAVELSIKEQAEHTQGPTRLVVIRKPDSGKIPPLPDVQGKGKEKRRTPTTTEPSGHADEEVSPEIARTQNEGQENLKLPTEDQVRLEEPSSSAGTLSSLQNLDKELSFTNQFLVEKSQEDEPDKSNTEAEV